jgi:hypothetical protein
MFHKADPLTAVSRKKKSARVADKNIAEEDDANKIRTVAKNSSMKGVRPRGGRSTVHSTCDFRFPTASWVSNCLRGFLSWSLCRCVVKPTVDTYI